MAATVKQIVETKKAETDFELPTGLTKPVVNMESCILFGLPKCGKTTLLSKLPNCLIIDTENGTNKVSALVKKIPDDKGPVSRMRWLEEFADYLIAKGKPYDYVALDTFTEVNEMAEWSGTYRYMHSTQGKKFNRKDDEVTLLKPDDDDYQSVHTVGQGFGYRWSREDTLRVFEKYMRVAKKCVFFVCHVEDKYLATRENTEVVAPKQLALTGKLRDILPRKVDGIGYVYNDEGTIKINFTGNEERVGGNRCEHLKGYNDVADWNKIFI
jgi:hypothetical protein